MPDRRWHKVARDLWLHRGRSALVVLAIAVGLAGAGAVLDAWALLRVVTRDEYLATNPASATVRLAQGDTVDAALLASARAVPNVSDVQARRLVSASVELDGAWRTALLFASNDPAAQRVGRLARVSGAWPPSNDALVIEHSSVELAGAALGDSLALRVGDAQAVRLRITGVARDAGL